MLHCRGAAGRTRHAQQLLRTRYQRTFAMEPPPRQFTAFGQLAHHPRATNGLLGQRSSRVSNFKRRRVGGGSAEFTSAEGGGACRPHQEGPRTRGCKRIGVLGRARPHPPSRPYAPLQVVWLPASLGYLHRLARDGFAVTTHGGAKTQMSRRAGPLPKLARDAARTLIASRTTPWTFDAWTRPCPT